MMLHILDRGFPLPWNCRGKRKRLGRIGRQEKIPKSTEEWYKWLYAHNFSNSVKQVVSW